jgi:hypothetical protein
MTHDDIVTYDQMKMLIEENRKHIADMFNQVCNSTKGRRSENISFQQLDGTRTGSKSKD